MYKTRTRVKFCGITSVEQGLAAVAAGADAIGLNFYEPSPRYVNPELAAEIAADVPAFVTVVGLFVDPEPGYVNSILEQVRIDLLQFHGSETEAFCTQFARPYMKAVQIRPGDDIGAIAEQYASGSALLVDAWHPELAGGSGNTLDWETISAANLAKLVLAGGLNPENVGEAIRTARPYAVDVSSGIEIAPGEKSPELMKAFSSAVAASWV